MGIAVVVVAVAVAVAVCSGVCVAILPKPRDLPHKCPQWTGYLITVFVLCAA
jgi:hypothetical protein